ncbi:unnamed protein product, partial [Brenthis ino]
MAKLFGVAYAKSALVQNASMIQMFLEKKIMLAPSTMTDRTLPDAPSTKTEALAASLTPFQIRSIPTMAAPKTGRKHKRQESEVLTSTPVKAEQAFKFKKANIKKTKISELEGPRKTKTKRSSV